MSPAQSADRRRLSVALVVRNAEQTLRATLESVRPLADQIVVLDAGSTDATAQLAEQFGATVLQDAERADQWRNNFSAARNACFAATRGDWVLWLDAGETLSVQAAQQLRQFVDQQANPQVGYLLHVTLPAEPGQLAGEQAARVRLVPRRSEMIFAGRVRESLLPAIAQAGMQVQRLPWSIERGERELDPAWKAARAERNLRLAKLELEQRGDQPEMLLTAGESLAAQNKPAKAAEFFRRAIDHAYRGSTTMLEAYYGLLTALETLPEGREQQLAACLEALEIYPLDAQLLCGMGSYMLAQNRPDLAVRSYRIAVQHGQIDPQAWHLPNMVEVAVACLSLTLQLLDQDTEARGVLEEALETHPASERLRRQLLNLYIKHQCAAEALAQVERLAETASVHEALPTAVQGAVLAAGRNWVAARPLLENAYRSGCRDVVCLRWLSVTYLTLGMLEGAEALLGQWQESEPGNTEITSYLSALAAAQQRADASTDEPASQPAAGSDTVRSRIRVDRGQVGPERPLPAAQYGSAPVTERSSLPS